MKLLLAGLALVSFTAVAAQHDDDGFIWLDANTRIKVLKPVSASSGETAAPSPAKAPKEEPKK